jgi:hypothetical protein
LSVKPTLAAYDFRDVKLSEMIRVTRITGSATPDAADSTVGAGIEK